MSGEDGGVLGGRTGWAWEYHPDEAYVVGGPTPAAPALVAAVEERADELVRVAEAVHVDPAGYGGGGEGVQYAYVVGGMLAYLTVPRQRRVYLLQVTAW